MLSHDDVVRIHGPWREHSPADVVDLLRGYPGRWWIAGGWAVQAFTGAPRPHGDLDFSIPTTDVDLLRGHLLGRLGVWAASDGALRPLVQPGEVLPDGSGSPSSWHTPDAPGSSSSDSRAELSRVKYP